MIRRRLSLALLAFWLPAALLAVALTAGGDPTTLFTDNVAATSATQDLTPLDDALVALIDGAATSVDLAIFDFNRISVRDALVAAQGRGVTVRVVTDDEAYHNPSYTPHWSALEAAGIIVVNDARSPIMHNKFIVVDGSLVWTGSTNISDNDFTLNHNNALVFTSTVLAETYTREFEQMFLGGLFGSNKQPSLTTTVSYQGAPLVVLFSPQDDALSRVIDEVNGASDAIYFSIFFFTDDGLRDALVSRAQAGVDIHGIWDLLGASNAFSDDEALCAAGIPIKIEDFPGKMHHKFMVIDPLGASPRVITGSMNWTSSGDTANDENTLIIQDGTTAQAYLAAWQTLWDALDPATQCVTGGLHAIYLPITFDGRPPPQGPVVQLAHIVYNPPGDDVAGERVEIRNVGNMAQEMAGWTIRDEAGATFLFPVFTLAPGDAVQLWTGSGDDGPADLFWGSGAPIWNNSGDVATLSDAAGAPVDVCSYEGGGSEADC